MSSRRSLLRTVTVLLMGFAALVWFNFGTIHPCGVLRHEYLHAGVRDLRIEQASPIEEAANLAWFEQQTPKKCVERLAAYYSRRDVDAILPPAEGVRRTLATEKADATAKFQLASELQQKADQLFDAGHFREPHSPNARDLYQRVLELDPYSTYVQRRLAEIEAIPR